MKCSRRGFCAMGLSAGVGAVGLSHGAESRPAPCSADFSTVIGKVNPLNGINLGPKISGRNLDRKIEEFKALNVSSVRLHDAPLFNASAPLVDVNRIFPVYNTKLDPRDPSNYFFDATDDYLKIIRSCGDMDIVYRLGPSIEHTRPNKYTTKDPKDHAHYAEVCAGIVRHYTKGWARGFDAKISHWEIWNEPDLIPNMFDKDLDAFFKLYVDIARRLRAEFPEIKIGGSAFTWGNIDYLKRMVAVCRREKVPLDFFSWHGYIKDSRASGLNQLAEFRKILAENGFPKTELHFNEWHYFPCTWKDMANPQGVERWRDTPDGLNGIDGAAFITWCLTDWQDIPLDVSNFYAMDGGGGSWGLYDTCGKKRPVYWGMKLFGDFVRTPLSRIKTVGGGSVKLLGGVAQDGRKLLLVTNFKPKGSAGIDVSLLGLPPDGQVQISELNGIKEPKKETRSYSKGHLQLPSKGESSIWLCEF